MTRYRRPPTLHRGDRVRVIAPSGPVPAARLQAGLALLRDWELDPVLDETGVLAVDAYLAGDDARRRQELADALADDEAAVLWAARGGYGAARLLPDLRDDAIAARPRWLIGFSDITALHARWQRVGLQSLHAANLSGLSRWNDVARNELRALLFDGAPLTLTGGDVRNAARPVSGPVLGGNLMLLASLVGTGYLPPLDDAILFIEDVGEAPYRLDRCLTQLRQAGVLDNVAAIAVGQLTCCNGRPEQDRRRDALGAVLGVLEPLGVPLLTGLAVGHDNDSRALPLGARAVLDPAGKTLSFDAAGNG